MNISEHFGVSLAASHSIDQRATASDMLLLHQEDNANVYLGVTGSGVEVVGALVVSRSERDGAFVRMEPGQLAVSGHANASIVLTTDASASRRGLVTFDESKLSLWTEAGGNSITLGSGTGDVELHGRDRVLLSSPLTQLWNVVEFGNGSSIGDIFLDARTRTLSGGQSGMSLKFEQGIIATETDMEMTVYGKSGLILSSGGNRSVVIEGSQYRRLRGRGTSGIYDPLVVEMSNATLLGFGTAVTVAADGGLLVTGNETINLGRSGLALSGTKRSITSPNLILDFENAGMVSPSSQSLVFSAQGDIRLKTPGAIYLDAFRLSIPSNASFISGSLEMDYVAAALRGIHGRALGLEGEAGVAAVSPLSVFASRGTTVGGLRITSTVSDAGKVGAAA